MTDNTILITGGGSGIGLCLVEVCLQAGNQVIITGRRQEKLREAQEKFPEIQTHTCDMADAEQRRELVDWLRTNHPDLNILVNNAGIQRPIDLTGGPEALLNGEDEIDINLKAPIQLTAALIPHLRQKPAAAIVNVSSGLGFVPLAFLPVYCATKAALHSFSLSLRHQLRKTSILVFEIIPPTVDTELDHGRRDPSRRGIPPMEVAQAAFDGMARDELEITVGQAQGFHSASPEEARKMFQRMNEG